MQHSDGFGATHRRLLDLDDHTWSRMELALDQLVHWNKKVNVISRKGFTAQVAVEKHFLPSLALLRHPGFRARLRASNEQGAPVEIIDIGTGGGFPGLPLAICFPEVKFTLVDARRKKIDVVKEIAQAAGASNVRALHGRVPEDLGSSRFDFALGRSVTNLPQFLKWAVPCLKRNAKPRVRSHLGNGVLYIKGGEFETEMDSTGVRAPGEWSIADELFEETVTGSDGSKIGTDKSVLYFPVKN